MCPSPQEAFWCNQGQVKGSGQMTTQLQFPLKVSPEINPVVCVRSLTSSGPPACLCFPGSAQLPLLVTVWHPLLVMH